MLKNYVPRLAGILDGYSFVSTTPRENEFRYGKGLDQCRDVRILSNSEGTIRKSFARAGLYLILKLSRDPETREAARRALAKNR